MTPDDAIPTENLETLRARVTLSTSFAWVVVRRSPTLTEADLVAWCVPRMAASEIPRFVVFVDEFRKTPTQRIQKQFLSRSVDDCWDRERPGMPQA